jgi:hypothetical protein
MKKLLSLAMALCLGLVLCSCGAAEPPITVADGVFSCTPQELIDGLNEAVKQADSNVIYSVGAYPGSGEELQIASTSLTLTLNETSDGNLSKIHLYWYSGDNNENVITSAGCYAGYMFSQLAPDSSKDLSASIGQIVSDGEGTTEQTVGNVKITFAATSTGANRLDITPTK